MNLLQPRRRPSINPGGGDADATGPLLALFADPDGRGERRWLDMFGSAGARPGPADEGFLAREHGFD